MQQKIAKKSQKNSPSVSLSLKYGVIFLLLTLSILLAACGANASSSQTAAAATATPKATSTMINFNKVNQTSPTPTLPAQWCGVWVTNESPIYGSSIPIYAKFVTQQAGNPVGIGNATVTLSIEWGDLTQQTQSAMTSADGLATTTISSSGHAGAVNKLSLITATFVSGNVTCSVGTDRPGSFALITGSAKAAKTDFVPTQTTPPANTNNTNTNPPTTQFPGQHGGKKNP